MDFIPANESALFIKCFKFYTWVLFKRRFSKIWIRQEYHPDPDSRAIYYLNHHSWWDGLIPFLLNEFQFHQQARAMMEDRQMREYPFFQRIGAFSVNRKNSKSTIRSLRYAVESLQRPNASLFIYPEGKITPPGSKLRFERGLAWLSKHAPSVDIVPVGIHMHTMWSDKPELHLHVGTPIHLEQEFSNDERIQLFEEKLEAILLNLRQTAGFNKSVFERLV